MSAVQQLLAAGGATEYTVVLTSADTSYTIPAGVTLLDSAVGKGSNGAADYWSAVNSYPFTRINGTVDMGSVYGATLDASECYNTQLAAIAVVNAGGSGERWVNFNFGYYNYVGGDPSTCTGGVWKKAVNPNGPYYVRGTALYNEYGVPTSGLISNANANHWWTATGFEWLATGAAGVSATGFGKTFPGGAASGGIAPTTTFTNVAVSPGSYPISIPSGGQITIKYRK